MLDAIERSGLDQGLADAFRKLDSLHSSFDSKLTVVDGRYSNVNGSFNQNAAQWLGLSPGTDVSGIQGSLMDSMKDMYYGSDVNGRQSLGLKEIHGWKREGAYKDINTKQQAGFAAEVISTTKENLIAKHEGTGMRTCRADDLPDLFPKNDQYVDKVRFDAEGNIVDRIQTKFVGKSGETCLSKLMSKKFDKYIYDGKVDKIEIPKDFYDEIRSNNLIEAKRAELETSLAKVKELGKTDVAAKYEARLDKLNRLDKMLEPSTVTMNEAIDAVKHPTRTTAKFFYDDLVKTGKEVMKKGNEAGIKSGLVAAGITMAVSTVDNVSAYIDGEITAEEMVVDIVKETAAAGAIEYGAEFISTAVSQTMSRSSCQLIRQVAGSSAPVAIVSFAVESYDSVTAYARGEIDGEELAYELGENAVTVAGAMKGATIGASIGSALGPAGSVAGGIVGGVVGAAVASEAYATAVELGAEGVEFLAEQAENLMKGTLELFEEHIPDKLDDAKAAFSNYIEKFDLPFGL